MTKDTPKKKREFGVILESIESKVQHVVEAVDDHTRQLKRLEPMAETLEQVKVDVDAMKTTLQGTESEKPLKKRVEELEAKTNA